MKSREGDIFTLTYPARAVLEECVLDYVDLWKVSWVVAAEFELTESERIQDAALAVVDELLDRKLVRAGVPRGRSDFKPWNLNTEEAKRLIRDEWKALNREPDIGEIAWFDVTDEGRMYLEKHVL